MDHVKILKRAFEITRYYRVLWIFGAILAVTTAGGRGSNGSSSNQGGGNGSGATLPGGFEFPSFQFLQQVGNTLIAIGVALACLILLLIIIGAIARYVSETSLIRMVDKYEATEEKLSFRQGFRLGWSRTAFRLFLIDLLVALAIIAVMIPLLLIAGAPLLLWTTNNNALGVAGTVASIGIFVLVIFVAILAGIVMALFTPFFRRVCALEDRGVIESIRRGFALVRQRPGDVFIMGLLQFGISLLGFILMIPVLILLFIVAVVVAGLPAAVAGGIASLFDQGATPWIVAAFVGAPVLILVIAAPSIFLNGLLEVFQSGIWTLAYRELLALETAPGEVVPAAVDPINDEKNTDHDEEQVVL